MKIIGKAQLAVLVQRLRTVAVRCLTYGELVKLKDGIRILAKEAGRNDVLVWMAIVDRRVSYLISCKNDDLKPFFKQIASDEKAGEIEKSFRLNRRNVAGFE